MSLHDLVGPRIVVLIVLALACSSPGDREVPTTDAAVVEEEPGLFAQAAVSADSALGIAKAHVPGGMVTKAVLEHEDGVLLYSFDLVVAGSPGITEVHVDAQTGVVLRTEHEGT